MKKDKRMTIVILAIAAVAIIVGLISVTQAMQAKKKQNKVVKNVLEKRYSKKFSDLITKMLVINENNRIDFINLEKVIRRKYL